MKLDEICNFVQIVSGISIKDIRSKSRKPLVANARKAFIYLACKCNYKLVPIAEYLHCDYSSVIHHRDSAVKMIETNDTLFMSIMGNVVFKKEMVEVVTVHLPMPTDTK